jgi:hypothetical protein
MNGFWVWYARLPDFTTRHPVPGLIISLAILYIIFICVTCPFLVLRLLARLFMFLVNGLARGARSISSSDGRLTGPTGQPPIGRTRAATALDRATGGRM